MDPFTLKEIAEVVTETQSGEVPNFDISSLDETGHLEASTFEDFDNDIPDFKNNPVEDYEKSKWTDVPQQVDPDTGVTKIELQSGVDKTILNDVPPPGNAEITVHDVTGDNYTVITTDEAGNKVNVYRPEIHLGELSPRNSNETGKTSDLMDGKLDADGNKMDDGAHLIAQSMEGSCEQTNLVPMDSEVNRHGEWRNMEREMAKLLEEGHSIEDFNVEMSYDDGTRRPTDFTVTYKLDGNEYITHYIENSRPEVNNVAA